MKDNPPFFRVLHLLKGPSVHSGVPSNTRVLGEGTQEEVSPPGFLDHLNKRPVYLLRTNWDRKPPERDLHLSPKRFTLLDRQEPLKDQSRPTLVSSPLDRFTSSPTENPLRTSTTRVGRPRRGWSGTVDGRDVLGFCLRLLVTTEDTTLVFRSPGVLRRAVLDLSTGGPSQSPSTP